MKVIDLFAGCGGLALGFKNEGFKTVAFLEWEKSCIETLHENFGSTSNQEAFIHADIREFDTFVNGDEYQLEKTINTSGGIDGVIGGPPCQAYSMAGRVRDPEGMRNDYRNYLFEAYCKILDQFKPRFFVFENVVGMLSAKPNGVPVAEEISNAFSSLGYYSGEINKSMVYNFADLGGPQNRRRVIIFGVRSDTSSAEAKVKEFHSLMRASKKSPSSVYDAIGDLSPIYPLTAEKRTKRLSHHNLSNDWLHHCRFHNNRDIEIFELLARDLQSLSPKYTSINAIKDLYTEKVGKTAAVHKYYVLRNNEPSNLIPAHLHKDGLRHIHPDPDQARSITAREAARLQTFPDNFVFKGSRSDIFKMIGNAVPPEFGSIIAKNVKAVL